MRQLAIVLCIFSIALCGCGNNEVLTINMVITTTSTTTSSLSTTSTTTSTTTTTLQSDFPKAFSIKDNKILDENSNEVVFRGINILDPGWLDAVYYKLNDGYISQVANWKAKIVRIPVHPAVFKYYGEANTLKIVDKMLSLLEKYEIYAIIDYHAIGFAPDGTYMDLSATDAPWTGSIYAYTDSEMKDFWRAIAEHYKDDNRVVFYELFNEPTSGVGDTDANYWDRWKNKSEEFVDYIRQYDSDAKIIINGLWYASNLSYALNNPVNRSNIIYGVHPYPNNGNFTDGDNNFGNLKAKYPVFATEFGYDPNAIGLHYQATSSYGQDVINYLESKKISWTVWNFSPDWGPALLSDWNYNTNTSGTQFKQYLQNLAQ